MSWLKKLLGKQKINDRASGFRYMAGILLAHPENTGNVFRIYQDEFASVRDQVSLEFLLGMRDATNEWCRAVPSDKVADVRDAFIQMRDLGVTFNVPDIDYRNGAVSTPDRYVTRWRDMARFLAYKKKSTPLTDGTK